MHPVLPAPNSRKRPHDSASLAIPKDWEGYVWRGYQPDARKFRRGSTGRIITRDYSGPSIPPQPWRGYLGPNNPKALFRSKGKIKSKTWGKKRVPLDRVVNYGAYTRQKHAMRDIPPDPVPSVPGVNIKSYYWGDMYTPGRGYQPENDPYDMMQRMQMGIRPWHGPPPPPGPPPAPPAPAAPAAPVIVPPAVNVNPGPQAAPDPQWQYVTQVLGMPDDWKNTPIKPYAQPFQTTKLSNPDDDQLELDPDADREDEELRRRLMALDDRPRIGAPVPIPALMPIPTPDAVIGRQSIKYGPPPAYGEPDSELGPPPPIPPWSDPVPAEDPTAPAKLVNMGTNGNADWLDTGEADKEKADEVVALINAAAQSQSPAALENAAGLAAKLNVHHFSSVVNAYHSAKAYLQELGKRASKAPSYVKQKFWNRVKDLPPLPSADEDKEWMDTMQRNAAEKLRQHDAEIERRKAKEREREEKKKHDLDEIDRLRAEERAEALRNEQAYRQSAASEEGRNRDTYYESEFHSHPWDERTRANADQRYRNFYKEQRAPPPRQEPEIPLRPKRNAIINIRSQVRELLGEMKFTALQLRLAIALHKDKESVSQELLRPMLLKYKDSHLVQEYISRLLALPHSERYEALKGKEGTIKGRGIGLGGIPMITATPGYSADTRDGFGPQRDKWSLYMNSDLDRRSTQNAGRGGPGFTAAMPGSMQPILADQVIPGVTPQMFNLRTGDFTPMNPGMKF